MQRLRIVSNRGEARGTLVDPLNPHALSHLSLDYARSCALAIPHNRALEPSSSQSQRAVLAIAPFVLLGSRMLAVLLAPVPALAGTLGFWRLGADAGRTKHFFIANGLLSHWQAWLAVAIAAFVLRNLNKWLEIQNSWRKGAFSD